MTPEPSDSVHFASARDGTRLFWRDAGAGDPPIVLSDGIGCAGFIWKRLFPALAGGRRVLHWNYRGHGRSERPRDPDRISLLDCVDDLFRVLDDAGIDRAVLAGHSMGVQVSLEAHRRDRSRVAALALVCGSYGRPLDTFHGNDLLARAFPYARRLVDRFPGAARFTFEKLVPTELLFQYGRYLEVNRRLVRRQDLLPYLADLSQIDPVLFVKLLATASVHDASDHLPQVDVPTLVVAGEHDTFTPMWLSLHMHACIPGSELLVLPGGTHVGPLERPELLAERMERFLRERLGGARAAC
ncbi:alpha/beta fold hydrolase [Anaeromyxobacter paludicola]|uniref:O-methylpimelyl-ACP methylesterase n=1 Tax=Anaeromyxobacter paludicola TaxID=2918171 RepID=A0ABN6N6R4_9BACT|nr:alpha/beta hydrolase [Anaeromyxobacter paludicola]BDG07680.1 O-methylpimelyl-ACP methylesterase [Anaeromyxobacter paludicola]